MRFLIFFLLFPTLTQAVKLNGIVTDTNQVPLPFATLYIEGTTQGTTTNSVGIYSFEVPPGDHTIIFQYVGYKTVKKEVSTQEDDITMDVVMESELVELQEVIVNASENPADLVIREAIKKRKFYLEQVQSFACDVYIKGLQTLERRPDKIFGITVPIDTGIVYLSESVSEYSFERPDKIKEKMISSKVSGYNSAFSFNQASEMTVNLYQNLLQYEGLTQRGIVSPIANNAFLFYNYDLVGTKFENGKLINKIEVIPKRANDPVCSGYLYIMEDSWRIHSADLLLTKSNQIEFVDSLRISQVFAPVTEDVWMILSQKFLFDLKVFGFEGRGNFVGVYSNYEVEPALDRKHFNNEVLSIDEESNKRDSLYWKSIRPIPLTALERGDYKIKDSLGVIRESKDYKDSTDRKSNKLTAGNIFVSGYNRRNSNKERFFHVDPITEIIQYNTIEGLVGKVTLNYRKNLDRERLYRIRPTIRYGFGNERWNAKLNLQYHYNRKKFSSVQMTFGRFVAQFNEGAISPLINAFETLVRGRNHLKLYGKNFWEGQYRTELTNGIMLTSNLSYEDRKELVNTSDYSFRNENKRVFTPNRPDNLNVSSTAFPNHQALKLSVQLRFILDQKYISRPHRKIIYKTKLPVVFVNFTKGLDILGSDVNYNQLRFWVNDKWDLGLVGKSQAQIEVGSFFGDDELQFPDFLHFDGNRTYFAQYNISRFQLLDYYLFSTNDRYFSAHLEHHFNGFLFNKIPVLRKLKLQGVASLHYLKIPQLDSYLELGLGIEHIFKVVRVDFFTSVLDVKRSGVRVGIGF